MNKKMLLYIIIALVIIFGLLVIGTSLFSTYMDPEGNQHDNVDKSETSDPTLL